MKVSELTGALLDYWVARIERQTGVEVYIRTDGAVPRCMMRLGAEKWFCPSINWAQGGPIIEREQIGTQRRTGEWRASFTPLSGSVLMVAGPTLLIAAMRSYVASKFGDEVPDSTDSAPL
jgi:hypothetical protein